MTDLISWDPHHYLKLAIAKGHEPEIINCITASKIIQQQLRAQFSPNQWEMLRVDLEHHVRVLVDTFLISRSMPEGVAGNAITTALVHNAGRYLALAVLEQGASLDAIVDMMAERMRAEATRCIVEFQEDNRDDGE